jgi:hypothetical protein
MAFAYGCGWMFHVGRASWGSGVAMSGSFKADVNSLKKAAGELSEAAHIVDKGKLNLDLLNQVAAPNTHPEIAASLRRFGEFANDQYIDIVSLLGALSTKLQITAGNYQGVDQHTQSEMDQVLKNSTFQSSSERKA